MCVICDDVGDQRAWGVVDRRVYCGCGFVFVIQNRKLREDASWAFEERGDGACATFGCYFKSISSCRAPLSTLSSAPHIGDVGADTAAVVVVDKVWCASAMQTRDRRAPV